MCGTEFFDLLVCGKEMMLANNHESAMKETIKRTLGIRIDEEEDQCRSMEHPFSDMFLLFNDFMGKDVKTIKKLKTEKPVFKLIEKKYSLTTNKRYQNQLYSFVRKVFHCLYHEKRFIGGPYTYDWNNSILVVVPPFYRKYDIQKLIEICAELYRKNIVVIDSNIPHFNYLNSFNSGIKNDEYTVINLDDYVLSISVVKKVDGKIRTIFNSTLTDLLF